MAEFSIPQQRDAMVTDLQSRMSPASTRPKIGVIGTGMMGREHIRAVLQLDQAVITGLYDTDTESLALAALEFESRGLVAPPCFSSAQALAESDQIDALFICTPNFTHRAVFDQVAASGKPVFLEKPMATTLEDALYLAERCQHYPAPIQVGMQYRFKSQYQLALRAIDAGELGAVHTVSLCEYRPPFLAKVDQWNKFAEYSGGTLVEKCCHYFDLLNRIAGSLPAKVFASGGRAVNFLDFEHQGRASDIDDHAMVIVEYENGIRGQFTLNMFSRELYEELLVGGERGLLRATEHASFNPGRPSRAHITVEVDGHNAYDGVDCTYPEEIELGGHCGSTLFEHDRFYRRLQGDSNDGATCNEGLWAIIIAALAQESIQLGTVVDVRTALADRGIDAYQASLQPDGNNQRPTDRQEPLDRNG